MAVTDKNKSTVERLKDLKSLYESGILTKEEVEAEKAVILGISQTTSSPQATKNKSSEKLTINKNSVKKAQVIEVVNSPEKISFWHSTKGISVVVISTIVIISIVGLFTSQCKTSAEQHLMATDSLTVDSVSVDSVIEEGTQTTLNNHTEIKNIKEKRGNFEVDIDWPVAMSEIEDISKLQNCIAKKAFGHQAGIHDCIEQYFKEESEEAENTGVPKECEGHTNVKFQQLWNGLCIFSTHYYFYGGCGTNGCVYSLNDYVIFDKDLERELNLDDIISDKSATLNIINDYLYNTDRCLSKADEVPDRFLLSPAGITFIFPKYTIWGGLFGEPYILFDYYELENALSGVFAKRIKNILSKNVWTKCSFTGIMPDDIRLDFERKGNELRNCIYSKSENDKKIIMTGKIIGNNYIFEGKDDNKTLKMVIDRHILEGTATYGSKKTDLNLMIAFPQ